MTQSEFIYEEAKKRLIENPDLVADENFIVEVIQDLYPQYSLIEQSVLLEGISIPWLLSLVREGLQESESYSKSPLNHVGMSERDFI